MVEDARRNAHRHMDGRLAAVELYPYHCRRHADYGWQSQLPSFEKSTAFVRELVNRATEGGVCLVVARGDRFVGNPVSKPPNLVVYDDWRRRSALLRPHWDGGRAILDWLAQHPTPPCRPAPSGQG